MPFRVSSTVFALTVRLVLRLTLHPSAALTSVCAMRIHIVYVDDQTACGHGLQTRRSEIIFRCCTKWGAPATDALPWIATLIVSPSIDAKVRSITGLEGRDNGNTKQRSVKGERR